MKTNDLNPYPVAPPPAPPPAGHLFTDPTFNTPILRVTDEHDKGGFPGVSFAQEYSAIYDAFNSDSTRIEYLDLAGFHYIAELDVGRRRVSNKTQLPMTPTGFKTFYWSRLDPNTAYVVTATAIYRLDCNALAYTLLVDLSKKLPGLTNADSRGMSWDDNRFHFSDAGLRLEAAYEVSTDSILGPIFAQDVEKQFPGLTDYLQLKGQMDTTGKLVLAPGWTLVNLETKQMSWAKSADPTRPGDPGLPFGDATSNDVHADWGANGMLAGGIVMMGVNGNGFPAFYPGFRGPIDPAQLATYVLFRKQAGPETPWSIDTHSSYRDRTGKWQTLCYDQGTPNPPNKWDFFIGEIFQLALDSPVDGSKNRRICRHYSDPASVDPGMSYWAAPKATMAQRDSLDAVAFNSTYKNGRVDMYIAFPDQPAALTGDEIVQVRELLRTR